MKYRHYKGGLYSTISVAKHSETGEVLMVYGGCGDGAEGIWARPYAMFRGNVRCEHCYKTWRRFTEIDCPPAEPCDCAEILELAEKHNAYNPLELLRFVRGSDDPEKTIQEMKRDIERFGSLFRGPLISEL